MKLTKKLPAAGKMAVTSEQSKALQEELIKLGYDWGICATGEPKLLKMPYLFWVKLSNKVKQITFGQNPKFFEEHNYPEAKFNNHFKSE